MNAVLEGTIVTKPRKTTATRRDSSPTIAEMEKALGIDKCRPIALSPSDEQDVREKGDVFKDWYEEELREAYKRRKQ